jgi:membrane protease YdiL (CAAX protease family)
MSSTISSINLSCTTSTVLAGVHSFGISLGKTVNATTKKIKDAMTSPIGQGVVGFGLGLGMYQIYAPLTQKIITFLGTSTNFSDPFSDLGLVSKILLSPLVCIVGPVIEEISFRELLQGVLKDKLNTFYISLNFSDSAANTASRVTSVFFASVIFGLIHFSNALVFWCNPVLFLPQVVASTIMGLLFSLAREFSGELHMPIGMHIGNNTLAWAYFCIKPFL